MIVMMAAVVSLLSVGMITVFSATNDTMGTELSEKQGMWIGVGVVLCVAVAMIRLELQVKIAHFILLGVTVLLAYLVVGWLVYKVLGESAQRMLPFMGGEVKGSFRWLKFGRYSLQPSEFAKFALLLFMSAYYGTRSKEETGSFVKGFLIPSLCAGVTLLLVMLGKDLSSTVVTSVMVGSLMFCGGVRMRYLLLVVLFAGAAFGAMIIMSPERISRITSFRDAEAQQLGDGFQLYRSQLALGSGGMTGRGYAKGVIKMGYLPERQTDFILSVWGEEMGFAGMLGVLLCYMALTVSLLWLGCLSRERTGMLICMGFSMLLATQSLTNIGVISGWGPTTGVPAPFVSYGGSSMMSLMMCLGLVFNVCRRMVQAACRENIRGGNLPTQEELLKVTGGSVSLPRRTQA